MKDLWFNKINNIFNNLINIKLINFFINVNYVNFEKISIFIKT